MNTMMKRLTITAAVLLAVSIPMFAEEVEGARTPRLLAPIEQAGSAVRVPVTLDLTAIYADSTPVVLGGYIVGATFDPAQVRFESAAGGANPMFAGAPVTTSAEKANAEGRVRVVGYQTNLYAPTGSVSVATLQFTELVPGGAATIRLELVDAAASPTPDRNGKQPERIGMTPERAE